MIVAFVLPMDDYKNVYSYRAAYVFNDNMTLSHFILSDFLFSFLELILTKKF